MQLTSIVHILLPETDNWPSWISGRERMTILWGNKHMAEWADKQADMYLPLIAKGTLKWVKVTNRKQTLGGMDSQAGRHVPPILCDIQYHDSNIMIIQLLTKFYHYISSNRHKLTLTFCHLTKAPITTAADDILWFFLRKISFNISCELSAWWTFLIKC